MKKILFNDKFLLTQEVLYGNKTMTRRLLKDNVPLGNWEETAKHLSYKVGEVVAKLYILILKAKMLLKISKKNMRIQLDGITRCL
mgnify:CR=1 FL=1